MVFNLPDLGEGLTEAELATWLVSVGDEISVDQPIAEVETAKSVVEVPSPYAGRVAVLHGEPGQTLDVGKPLISVALPGSPAPASSSPSPSSSTDDTDDTDDTVEKPAAEGNTRPVAEAAATAYREEEKAGSGNVLIGYGTPGGHGKARRSRPPRSAMPVPHPHTAVSAPAGLSEVSPGILPEVGRRISVSSPLVRRLAHESGIDLSRVHGTGAAGLVLRRDVEAAIAALSTPVEQQGPRTLSGPEGPTVNGDAGSEGAELDSRTGLAITSREPVRGVRKTVAANMSRSRTEIPEATVWVDVDASELIGMRDGLKKRSPEDTPGLLAFIARFVTSGLAKYPELNTRFQDTAAHGTGDTKEIIGFDGVNLGFAAQTDRGLVVPSIRHADKLSARELDAEIRRLGDLARTGKVTTADLGGSTFTLNNYGVFGVDGSAAIINHPEAAMLGVGRIMDRAWVVDGALTVRKIVQLTLVFDHRVCDGGAASAFLRHVVDSIESPASALADL